MTHKLIIKHLLKKKLQKHYCGMKKQRKGLAIELLNEIDDVFERIISNPENFQERYKEIKDCIYKALSLWNSLRIRKG